MQVTFKKLKICTLIFVLLSSSSGLNSKVTDVNELETQIDALIPKDVNDTSPGLIIGIVNNGKLIFNKGYGLGNISYGISNDSQMVYNLGSVSKQFLGYAFAMLHVEGALNIDDSVGKYLEDWPEFEYKVTLRHLLSHSSGYREAYTLSNLAGRPIGVDRLSRKECLDVIRNQPKLEFIPGSTYTYNSTTWVVLAEVLEKVTGQSADKWVETNILKPLKMTDTQIESYVGEVIINSAESYSYDTEQNLVSMHSNRAIFGAAEVYSNIVDMTKWINNFKTAEVGGKKVNEMFLKPFILNDGSSSKYGLGITNDSYRGLRRYRHTGGHEAFMTQLSYFPDQDLGIFIVSNFDWMGWLETSIIADLLLKDHMEKKVDMKISQFKIQKDKLEKFAGIYIADTFNDTIELQVADESLVIGNTVLIPTAKNTYGIEGSERKIKIDEVANYTKLIDTNRIKKSYVKVKKWSPKLTELNAFIGGYWSDELETLYHVKINDKNLVVKHRWLGELVLEPVTQDFFKTSQGYYFKFNRNEKGGIINLSVNTGRTLNVIFQRKD